MDGNNNISRLNWIRKKLTGYGDYNWADGSRYVGDWVNGERHGFGKMEYTNGNIYVGSWTNFEKTGQGKFEWHDGGQNDGDIYEGEFQSSACRKSF